MFRRYHATKRECRQAAYGSSTFSAALALVEEMCETDTVRLRNEAEHVAVTIKAPRATVLYYWEALLIVAI